MLLMLWSAPRSRSTAFFRMMAERGDFTVVHEPFSYLAEFGYADVAGTRVTSAPDLIAMLRDLGSRTRVFAKETTGKRYPEVLASPSFLASDAVHTFLIRHPRETIASYVTLNPDAPVHKIGFESLYEVYASVTRLTGRSPVVVDAADLMRQPVAVISAYCARAGIPFLPAAMRWKPADRPEWELSRRWHAGVASSSGFAVADAAARADVDVERHPVLGGYLRHHLPYYQALHARRLTVGQA
jgi:hypothetical protein